jgi:hypothetical protein
MTTSPTANRRAHRWDRALILGVPLAWAALLLLHPTGDTTVYDVVDRDRHAWQVTHVGMVAAIPLMAHAVHRLLRGLIGPAARVSRLALPVFAATYGAFEAIMGVGTGNLVAAANDTVAAADREALVDAYAGDPVLAALEHAAGLACGVALVAAAFALRGAGRIGRGQQALLVAATPLIAVHVPPFGPVGLVLFAIVASSALATTPNPQPTATDPWPAGGQMPGPG